MREVLNYRISLYHAVGMMNKIPLSQRLIRETHQVLMQGVRGYDKAPGQDRRLPNSVWIGSPGGAFEDARFIPCPVEELHSAMNAWEYYIHGDELGSLVQLAIVHAEAVPMFQGLQRIGSSGTMTCSGF